MVSVNEDANLRIMALAQIEVRNTTANLHHAILIQATFIAVTNGDTIGIQTGGTLKLRKGLAAIICMIIAKRIDLFLMIVGILLIELWFRKHHDIGLLAIVCRLLNAYAVTLITVFGL